jgi:hypothetical protein
MAFDSTSRFLPGSRLVFGSLLFIVDKMGDLSLHQPEWREIIRSDTDHFPLTSTRAGVACEAWLGRGSIGSGEFELGPSGDSVDHHEICCPDTTDPIWEPWLEPDSDGQEVFIVGQGDPPCPDETEAEIARAAKAEIT